MRFTPGCAQHIGMRTEQQDAFGFSDIDDPQLVARSGVLAVLADGMGGLPLGRQAAEAAVEAALTAHQQAPAGMPAPDLLQGIALQADSRVRAIRDREGCEAGATLAAVLVEEDALHWVSIGDSRVYLARRGELVRLTEDQNLSAMLLRRLAAGVIGRSEAFCHPDRRSLTNYLGSPDLQRADANIRPFLLATGDWLLLCSDGLFETLSEREIADELYGQPADACERLVERTLAARHPHQDNVTALVLSCGERESAEAAGGTSGSWLWRIPLLSRLRR